eukprot:765368-Hanusia_phi.AAC.1
MLALYRVTVFRAGANDEWALMNDKVVQAGLTEEHRAQEVMLTQYMFPLHRAHVSCSPARLASCMESHLPCRTRGSGRRTFVGWFVAGRLAFLLDRSCSWTNRCLNRMLDDRQRGKRGCERAVVSFPGRDSMS